MNRMRENKSGLQTNTEGNTSTKEENYETTETMKYKKNENATYIETNYIYFEAELTISVNLYLMLDGIDEFNIVTKC